MTLSRTTSGKEKIQQYSVYNFRKLKCIVVIFFPNIVNKVRRN